MAFGDLLKTLWAPRATAVQHSSPSLLILLLNLVASISRILKFILFSRVDTSDFQEEKGETVCDVTKGKWVYDESYPLYSTFTCPFIDEGFNYEANGILDKDYMKWRWKPHDCYIPR
uniref:Trichome birefringence-like N-terminal domain-containing protein n=2 Tax=Lactuca sativa TaxID=4236 RepID=A0A9R1WJX2_LACSA|nr:hypothetical protein LSAT_V11C100048330 [Lactuca sativa]